MRILLIDGQGGGIGSRLATLLRPRLPEDCELLCAGTNVLATNAMLKAGCTRGATGENAILYNAVSPAAAAAVSGAQAVKILIPSATCGTRIAGVEECRLEDYLKRAVDLALREVGL